MRVGISDHSYYGPKGSRIGMRMWGQYWNTTSDLNQSLWSIISSSGIQAFPTHSNINITNFSFHTSYKQPLFCTISKSLPSQTKSMEVTHIYENCNNPMIICLINSKMRLQITRASWDHAFPSTQKRKRRSVFFFRDGDVNNQNRPHSLEEWVFLFTYDMN